MFRVFFVFLATLFFTPSLSAEPLRIFMAGTCEVSASNPDGTVVPLSYTDSAVISLEGDNRFLRGIQLDLTAPQSYLPYRGSLAYVIYSELDRIPPGGAADVNAREISLEALPGRILNTWQIPVKQEHGLRASPYVTIPAGVVLPPRFPLIFRLMPVIKGISEEMEKMVFELQVKPVLSDEGLVKINLSYPENLPGKPVTVLIDDVVVNSFDEEQFLKEGEHNLVILSDHYRNQSRRFMVARAKALELQVELEDPTPLLIFEYPENARILLNNELVENPDQPKPVEPGVHEICFQISDYSIVRPFTVQKGKTYRIALSVDVDISENE